MEWDIPNTVESKFRIASITKPFTAILIMQLVANNTLELNAPISNYLPDYPKENGDKGKEDDGEHSISGHFAVFGDSDKKQENKQRQGKKNNKIRAVQSKQWKIE